jgi:hypothetical protein
MIEIQQVALVKPQMPDMRTSSQFNTVPINLDRKGIAKNQASGID